MQVFNDLESLANAHSLCVATIGKYDGMHLGHQHILKRLKTVADAMDLPTLVILSEPQPEEFFAGAKAPARLLSFTDKISFLESQDIDLVYKMTFDQHLSELSAATFVEEVLARGLGVKALIVGDDFRFGKGRGGDFYLLEEMGKQLGFSVEAAEVCLVDDERVSSTLVRQKLESGDCEGANELLGRPYQLKGEVIKGQQLGRELGYPTANIDIGMQKLAIEGVFAVTAELDQHSIQGVASVGYKPSIEGSHELTVEVFLFDFNDDIYGETLGINFLTKIRSQEKFPQLSDLQTAIESDIQKVKYYFQELQLQTDQGGSEYIGQPG
tara:strand:+ start:2616 stop:3593 length:978 start_codon:yes stop_codon:yes gene_type:complete